MGGRIGGEGKGAREEMREVQIRHDRKERKRDETFPDDQKQKVE